MSPTRRGSGRVAPGRQAKGRPANGRPAADRVVIPVERPARGSRGGFGRTWWGRAWVEALEQRARLDPNRLPRGRTYARSGSVSELAFVRGEVQAEVQGSRVRPYAVRVRVRPFTDDEWDRVLDTVAGQLGHTAALLDGELPPEIADDVAAAGLDLLPGAGEVGASCSCPDVANPCKHAAAVCYLIAGASDADPFVLLLLRGRGREEVLAGLRARRSRALAGGGGPGAGPGAASEGAQVSAGAVDDPGVDARAVFAGPPPSGAVPLPPLPPERPGQPAVPAVEPPGDGYPAREDLVALAADAAERAWELAAGVGDGGFGLDFDADLARRAARAFGTPTFPGLAARAGRNPGEMARWALAWRYGGPGGLAALRDDGTWVSAAERGGYGPAGDWSGEDEAVPGESRETAGVTAGTAVDVASAVAAGKRVLAERTGARPRAGRNRVTSGAAQLRLGRDGLWYPYTKSGTAWNPAGPPDPDPASAASVL